MAPGEGDCRAVVEHLRKQAEDCQSLGSPFYAILLRGLADDAAAGGVTARLLRGHVGDLRDLALSLRMLGAVHRLVLTGQARTLATHYPTVGGDGDAERAVGPFLQILAEHEVAVLESMRRAPQTNEVGRAAALVGALCQLISVAPLPIRLVELGASAGLNLRCDRFKIQTDDGRSYGPADSPAVLERAWRGSLPPMGSTLELVERTGCDPHPVDPATNDGALTLRSYVWPDQAARVARLDGALSVAAEVPATVEQATAAEFLSRVDRVRGTWLVVWHSVMWQYLDPAEQAAVLARLDEFGGGASRDSPVAHVALEPRWVGQGQEFQVFAQTWPDIGLGPGEHVLGTAAPHGIPVSWV